jgi:hypothetical protein
MTDRTELTRRWEAHWRDASPSYRVAVPHFAADFGAEGSDSIKRPTRAVAIATMAKALRRESEKLGHPVSDNLLRMMLGQKLGCEGAMPGLMGTTFAGTNNSGAAQVPGGAAGRAWMAAKSLMRGWGAFAHKDSNPPGPAGGPYIGWYYIAPSVSASAAQWLTGYGGTRAVLTGNPSTPAEYARMMYDAHYFTGLSHDREKEIGNYASCIARAMPSLATINGPANDPDAFSVDPSQFRSLKDRHITPELFQLAKNGKQGSAWAFLLPSSWADMVESNGVVWMGEPLSRAASAAHAATQSAVSLIEEHPKIAAGGLLAFLLGLSLAFGKKTP